MVSGFFARLTHRLLDAADPYTATLEAGVFAAFATSLTLSFFGALGSAPIYALVWLALGFACFKSTTRWHSPSAGYDAHQASRAQYRTIGIFLIYLVGLSFFLFPASADGQRVKLARILLAVEGGSIWDISRVAAESSMYFFPAPFYLIFAPIEALRLPQMAYTVINTVLTLGAMLNLWLLFGHRRSVPTFFALVIFFLAPQFLFAAHEEHEEALTLFLSTRCALWLLARPTGMRSLVFAIACGILAVAIKYSVAIFLPCMLLALALYFADRERLRYLLQPRTIASAIAIAMPLTLFFLTPDILVNASRGISITDQISRMSAYHGAKAIEELAVNTHTQGQHCGLWHLLTRLFEFSFDAISPFLYFFKIDASKLAGSFQFMPYGCAHDDTRLATYLTPVALARDSTQFGFLFIFGLLGIGFAPARKRLLAAGCICLCLAGIAAYSLSFMYWGGTGRYFMLGIICLLPAFFITLNALANHPKRWLMPLAMVWLAGPGLFIAIRSFDAIPRAISQGPRISYRAAEMVPALNSIRGPANIYFNDLMPFYGLLRLIPSREVSLQKAILPTVTNVVMLPKQFTDQTNWHDEDWLLPVPAVQGGFVAMGEARKNLGNVVPTAFFMTAPQASNDVRYRLVFVPRTGSVTSLRKQLGREYIADSFAKEGGMRYFIWQKSAPANQGLCITENHDGLFWQLSDKAGCL